MFTRGGLRLAATVLCASLGSGIGNAASVVGGSDLLIGGNLAQIESWLVNDPQLTYNGSLTFTNIFDKAPGNTPANFHTAADGKGPTVVLMEATVGLTTYLIGGFNPQSWNASGWTVTPNANDRTGFIFNLSTPVPTAESN